MNTIELKNYAFDYILEQEALKATDKLLLGSFVKEADVHQVLHLLLFGTMAPPLTEDMKKDTEVIFKLLFEVDWRTVGVDASVKAGEALEKGAEKAVKIASTKGISALRRLASAWANYQVPDGNFKIHGISFNWSKYMNAEWHKQFISANAALHAGAALATLAVAALIYKLGQKAYKSHLSKASRSCKGKEKAEKKACVRSYYMQAVKNEMRALESHKGACSAAKNPDKCVKAVSKRIVKAKAKLQKVLTKKNPY